MVLEVFDRFLRMMICLHLELVIPDVATMVSLSTLTLFLVHRAVEGSVETLMLSDNVSSAIQKLNVTLKVLIHAVVSVVLIICVIDSLSLTLLILKLHRHQEIVQ